MKGRVSAPAEGLRRLDLRRPQGPGAQHPQLLDLRPRAEGRAAGEAPRAPRGGGRRGVRARHARHRPRRPASAVPGRLSSSRFLNRAQVERSPRRKRSVSPETLVEPFEPTTFARTIRGERPVFRTRIFFSLPEKRPESFDSISEFEKRTRQRWTGERRSNGSLTDFRYGPRASANTNSEFSVCPPEVEKKNAVAMPPPALITSPAVAVAALFVAPVSDELAAVDLAAGVVVEVVAVPAHAARERVRARGDRLRLEARASARRPAPRSGSRPARRPRSRPC